MTSYAAIDANIRQWAESRSLTLNTSWDGREARFAYVSSIAGECFQIWIEPPADGRVILHALCVEGRKDSDDDENWQVALTEIDAALENAFQTVLRWMAPSQHDFPPSSS